jgi:acyl dehydratase
MIDASKAEGLEFPSYTFVVERGKIKEFAQAIGDPNPVYTDKEYAVKQGYRDVIASPTFATVIDMWGGSDFEATCKALELNPVMVLHGEQEYEYFQEINPGDEITARSKVLNVTRKEGKAGAMNILTMQTTYTNQRGEKVLVCRSVIVERV